MIGTFLLGLVLGLCIGVAGSIIAYNLINMRPPPPDDGAPPRLRERG